MRAKKKAACCGLFRNVTNHAVVMMVAAAEPKATSAEAETYNRAAISIPTVGLGVVRRRSVVSPPTANTIAILFISNSDYCY